MGIELGGIGRFARVLTVLSLAACSVRPVDAMKLPAQGQTRTDASGDTYRRQDGKWMKLAEIDPRPNVFDKDVDLVRLTDLSDIPGAKFFKFSHFADYPYFNSKENRFEVEACGFTVEERGCGLFYKVPESMLDRVIKTYEQHLLQTAR